MALIDVIIPVYQAENDIHRCIASIMAQTFQDWRLILVDDGSPDKSGMICDEYCRKDNRITVIHQTNQGVSAARNTGLRAVRSPYVAFIDADDYVAPDYFQTLYHDLLLHHADVACCNYVQEYHGEIVEIGSAVKSARQIAGAETILLEITKNQEFFWCCVWGKLFTAKCLQDVQFRNLGYGEDTVFMMEVITRLTAISLDPYPGYYYVRNDSSVTMDPQKELFRRMSDLEKNRHLWELLQSYSPEIQTWCMEEYAKGICNMANSAVAAGKIQEYHRLMKPHLKALRKERHAISSPRLWFRTWLWDHFPRLYAAKVQV